MRVLRSSIQTDAPVLRRGGLSLVPAQHDHMPHIARHMRLPDVRECALMGYSVSEALSHSVDHGISFTLMSDHPVGACGVVPISADRGRIWFLATDEIYSYKHSFMRGSIAAVRYFHRMFRQLENICPEDNADTLMWLSWLGFSIRDVSMTVRGVPFVHFVRCDERRSPSYS